MSETETETRPTPTQTLPMVIGTTAARPSLARSATQAEFLSQLLAARQHLAVQRARRRAPIDVAVDAYRTSAVVTRQRMPQGYRRTVVA
jgi:hypothetical protein